MSADNPKVFLDISIDKSKAERIEIELFYDQCPLTCENFKALCTGEQGISQKTGKPMCYKGSVIHKVIEGFMIQGGDFVSGDGRGCESIYGGKFNDERLDYKFTKRGDLGMANLRKNTNGSQFFITLVHAGWLDG